MPQRPVPVPDEISAPYWEACARHVLTLPRCSHCQGFSLPPEASCPHCHSLDPDYSFDPVAPRGTVRTWTVIRQSFLSGFDVPFVLVDVQLEEQPHIRMIGRLLDGPEAPLAIGEVVDVAFEDLAEGISVPAFAKVSRA